MRAIPVRREERLLADRKGGKGEKQERVNVGWVGLMGRGGRKNAGSIPVN